MVGLELARRLQEAGLVWRPASGDRFVVPDRDMDDDVFVVSDMTIEVHHQPTGPIIGFNGTTEWALDSIEQDAVVWLPREDQLRAALGEAFVRLEMLPEVQGAVVVLTDDGIETRHADTDPEKAYARALLARLQR